ncbi:MAG: cell division/cell wall cluster transcriptional repressor MraZ [Chloroflexi bacterium]|nr:cell division/cell wall cluster transcriptional repressor MraZ [Chloroflexota bacterium]MDA1004615.1 cell division/cell wall cluster transcriptional repressor MraZ [Chloroflexota bacterium]
MYFFGTFEHSVDERGRVAIPARYRHAFVDGGVLRAGPDGCVELYTQNGFEQEVQRRLGSEESQSNRRREGRRVRRGFLHGAYTVDLDRQGRVLLPPPLRLDGAADGRAVVVGCGDYVEIWSPDAWSRELERVAAEEAAEDEEV